MANVEVKLTRTEVLFLIDWGNRKNLSGLTDVERKLMSRLGAAARAARPEARRMRYAEKKDGWIARASRLLDAEPARYFRAQSLAEALGCSYGTAGTTLARLERLGRAIRVQRGVYTAGQRNLPFAEETATTETQEAA